MPDSSLYALCGSGRPAGRNQANEAIPVAVSIGPVDFFHLGPRCIKVSKDGARPPRDRCRSRAATRERARESPRRYRENRCDKKAMLSWRSSYLDIRVDGVAIVDRDPYRAGPHDAQHAEQNSGIVMRVNRRRLFAFQPGRPHGTRHATRDLLRFSVGITGISIDDCGSIRMSVSAFVEATIALMGETKLFRRGLRVNLRLGQSMAFNHLEQFAISECFGR